MELRKRFGKRLRQLRRYRELTQEQLAEQVELSVEMISYMERGVHAPSFATLEKLERLFQIPVHELFVFDDLV